jgi:FKBP-type peptidyl-prolyl cis-trans isomerase SlyD
VNVSTFIPERAVIQDGSNVKFHYKLRVGEEDVESSFEREPLEYQHGEGQILPGLEEELAGLSAGDRKTVTIPPARAYGERDDTAVQEVPRDAFQNVDELAVGDVVSGQVGGKDFRAVVDQVQDETVTLDLNHPLAGKSLTFEVEIVEVG